MADDLALFDVEPVIPAEPVERLSAGGRLRVRQQAMVANGRHPLTRGVLHPDASRDRTRESGKSDPFTCGSCRFRRTGYEFPKCLVPNPLTGKPHVDRLSHSTTTDVRAWWPACPAYEPIEEPTP